MTDETSIRVLILGAGKSGTTALMSAVSQALGAPYEMEPKRLGGLDYRKTFVAKKLVDSLTNHELKFILGFEKVIFLVRDPRDVMISGLMYRPYGQKVFEQDVVLDRYLSSIELKIADPSGVSICNVIDSFHEITGIDPVEISLSINKKLIQLYTYYGSGAFLMKYEDFVSGRTQELETYLGVPLPKTFKVDDKFKRVSRLGATEDWKNWFTRADQIKFDALFAESYDIFGYAVEALPPRQEIDRCTSVDYVRRIVDESRERQGLPLYGSRFAGLKRVRVKMKKTLARMIRLASNTRKREKRPKVRRSGLAIPSSSVRNRQS